MAGRPALVKQADIARAVKGARNGGLDVSGVEIRKDGTIVVLFGTPEKPTEPQHDIRL
ncbi:hypothetical protein [Breoghania sp. L-A4]|uniref:hypothetical protein n=1 Tax=Breoghania sp. L-A4 TaxID=2304600 RepID=UPI0013C2BB2F|nr:hypothetical protein [Breoghania sp. L-A4]